MLMCVRSPLAWFRCRWAVANLLSQPRDGNLFLWDVALIVVNPTSLYSGAYLKVCSFLLVPHGPRINSSVESFRPNSKSRKITP